MDPVLSVRAPLRISLGGGGTDLPSYYRSHGGFVLSAAIDRYVRVRVSPASGPRFRLEHLFLEEVDDPAEVEHPILRAALARHWNGRPLTWCPSATCRPAPGWAPRAPTPCARSRRWTWPSGRDPSPGELAEAACDVELGDLGRTVGKQDQYAAAHGGANAFTFGQDGRSRCAGWRSARPPARRSRSASCCSAPAASSARQPTCWPTQVERTLAGDDELRRNLARAEELARAACAALEADEPDRLGELMNDQWALKRERLAGVPMDRVEHLRIAGPGRRRPGRDAGGRGRRRVPAGVRRRPRARCARR